MGKILKEYENKFEKIALKRYIIGNKFRFTIETTDLVDDVITELEYIDHESALNNFLDLTMEYDFSEV
jgi:hypothetical protein